MFQQKLTNMLSFKILMSKIAISFLLLGLVFLSCNEPQSSLVEYGPIFEKIMISDTSVFRGFNFGDSLNFVQAKEANKPVEEDNGYLYYEYKLDSEGSFNIAYNFDELGLNEIHSDIFINDADNAEEVFNKFKTYFDEHFGASQAQMGFTIWSVKSEKYGEVVINLSNESTDFTIDKAPGKISLWIYPDRS